MPRMFLAAAVAALAGIVALGPAPAGAQPRNFQPVALTQDSANRAIDAMPSVYQVARQYEGIAGQGEDPMGGLAGLATYAAAQADLSAAVIPHGFSGYQDWVSVIQTIFHAYAYVQSAPAMQQMAPMMDQAVQQIINNPNIPQAQKDAILAQMGAAGGAHSAMQANAPSQANQDVVAAIGPRIEEMVDWLQAQP